MYGCFFGPLSEKYEFLHGAIFVVLSVKENPEKRKQIFGGRGNKSELCGVLIERIKGSTCENC